MRLVEENRIVRRHRIVGHGFGFQTQHHRNWCLPVVYDATVHHYYLIQVSDVQRAVSFSQKVPLFFRELFVF